MNKEKKKTKMYTNIEAATEFHSIEYQKFDRKCVRVCVWVLERERDRKIGNYHCIPFSVVFSRYSSLSNRHIRSLVTI